MLSSAESKCHLTEFERLEWFCNWSAAAAASLPSLSTDYVQ